MLSTAGAGGSPCCPPVRRWKKAGGSPCLPARGWQGQRGAVPWPPSAVGGASGREPVASVVVGFSAERAGARGAGGSPCPPRGGKRERQFTSIQHQTADVIGPRPDPVLTRTGRTWPDPGPGLGPGPVASSSLTLVLALALVLSGHLSACLPACLPVCRHAHLSVLAGPPGERTDE